MRIEQIITLANSKVRLRFLAMERSLRATGCDLPLRVIPYNDERFELPANAEWWEIPEILRWLSEEHAHPTMRKYQCLTVGNYQFVDSDVCFLRNPVEVLADQYSFVTSCGHWKNTDHTCTAESQAILAAKSTNWQRNVFNTGQFASEAALYDLHGLIDTVMLPGNIETCLRFPHHEQPGLNLLVSEAVVEITNLTLPPYNMESTWAGDYAEGYEHYWIDSKRKPYLIHWAGLAMEVKRPIDELFLQYLTTKERSEWESELRLFTAKRQRERSGLRRLGQRVKRASRELFYADL